MSTEATYEVASWLRCCTDAPTLCIFVESTVSRLGGMDTRKVRRGGPSMITAALQHHLTACDIESKFFWGAVLLKLSRLVAMLVKCKTRACYCGISPSHR